MKTRHLIVTAFLLALIACGRVETGSPADSAPGVAEPGMRELLIEDRDSLPIRPYRGRVVAMALGCFGCEHSEAMFESLEKSVKAWPSGVVFFWVLSGASVETVTKALWNRKPGLHVIGDPGGGISRGLPTRVTPTLFLFGKWGEVRYMGTLEEEGFRTMMDALLKETKPEGANVFIKVPLSRGEPLPRFDLKDPGNAPVSLIEQMEGAGAFVLAFVGVGCDASQDALDALSNMAVVMSDEGVRALAVHVGEDTEEVRKHYMELDLPFPVCMDPGGKVADLYAIVAKPTLFVAGPDGKVALRMLWHEEAVDQEVRIVLGLLDESERQDFAGEDSR